MLGVALTGCGGVPDTPSVMTVYRQHVPGSAAVIYDVHAHHYVGMNGREVRGLIIADSTEPFRYSYGTPMHQAMVTGVSRASVRLASFPETRGFVNPDTLTAESIVPTGLERTRVSGAEVEIVRYRIGPDGGSPQCGLRQYGFASFEERADSLHVRGLTPEYGYGPPPESLSFPKGNVWADLDDGGFVEKLEVEQLVVGLLPSHVAERWHELVERPKVCVATYWLTRTGSGRQRISDHGVFKRVLNCNGDC